MLDVRKPTNFDDIVRCFVRQQSILNFLAFNEKEDVACLILSV
jgi:hypothetical protein